MRQKTQKQQEFTDFLAFIKNLELKKIWLDKGEFELFNFSNPEGKNTYYHTHEYEINDAENDLYIVRSISHVNAINSEEEDLFKTTFEFVLLYHSKVEFTEEFFEKFKSAILPSHSYPYEREFIQNLIIRMNLPSLTLPMWKSPIVPVDEKPPESQNKKSKTKVKKTTKKKSVRKKLQGLDFSVVPQFDLKF